MRILVTGANGLLGSRVAAHLALQGHEVFATGRGERRCEGAFAYGPCDLARAHELAALFAQAAPERVIHCAAIREVGVCEQNPDLAFAINVTATAQLAQLCRQADAHLAYVSTDYVFDGEAGPYDEDAVPNPQGTYALTKHMGEQAVRALAGSGAICRTAIVYGWHPGPRLNFGAWLVTALREGRKVPLFSDQLVTPSLASHVAQMVSEIACDAKGGIWHCAGAQALTRIAFGEALCRTFGFDPALLEPIPMAEVPLTGFRPPPRRPAGRKGQGRAARPAARARGIAAKVQG
jgi:dTDP-4-dehydrorhamnose reductase